MIALGAKGISSPDAKRPHCTGTLICWSRVAGKSGHCPPASGAWFCSITPAVSWISSEQFVLLLGVEKGGARNDGKELRLGPVISDALNHDI